MSEKESGKASNNRAEIKALLLAYELINDSKEYLIYTNS